MGLVLITINGIQVAQPSEHGWIPTEPVGVGARGNTILSAIYAYNLSWDILTTDEYNELWDIWFNNQNVVITAQLPEIGIATYSLKSYDCIMNPVISQNYFEGHYERVSSALVNIDITA